MYVKCTESRVKKDQLGRLDNHVLRFLADGHGVAVLHLHHTQQLVQIQGCASQWFVNHFLKQTLITEARKHKILIDDLNKQFDTASHSASKRYGENEGSKSDRCERSCFQCNQKFRSNAKSIVCKNCDNLFHNSKQKKCFSVHNCLKSVNSHNEINQQCSQFQSGFLNLPSIDTSRQHSVPSCSSSVTPLLTQPNSSNSDISYHHESCREEETTIEQPKSTYSGHLTKR